MRILMAGLAIGLAAVTPPPHARIVVSPPNALNFNPSTAAHFCISRVLDYRIPMSVEAAKAELEWCYEMQLPRA